MKYFLKNIAQKSLMRTILLVLIGLFFCIISLWGESGAEKWAMVLMVLLNSFVAMQCAYKVGWTNLPSGFVLSTVWVVLSALLMWHLEWQIHLVAMMLMLAVFVIKQIDIQAEATEQAYVLTLMCMAFAPHIGVMIAGGLYIMVALIIRSHFTWKVLLAMLFAVATYVLFSIILRYFGWLELLWMENIPRLSWHNWLMGGAVYLLLWVVLYLPIQKPSVASGIMYIIGVMAAIAAGILQVVL
jgi:hypothetical protein